LKAVNRQSQDTLVSFDVVSLFTNVRANETLQIIENKLHNDDDKFFQQKDGMAMGNSFSPIVSDIFMKHFEKLALDSAPYKPSLWLWYVDDTFVVWPHGPGLSR
jgi:hypothetical protein